MCPIALSKSTEKVKKITIVTAVKVFFYFLSTFWKWNLTHLTTDVMFSGRRFAIIAMFSSYLKYVFTKKV